MPATTPNENGLSNVFALARALSRSGKVKVSRKERLQLALVELRDRIYQEFVGVAKSWRVSAQELRRDYSYAYPVPALGEPDALCLEKACHETVSFLRCDIGRSADEYGVPSDLMELVVVDWLVADLMGKERTPTAMFIRTADGGYGGLKDLRLPTAWSAVTAFRRRFPKTVQDGVLCGAGPGLLEQGAAGTGEKEKS